MQIDWDLVGKECDLPIKSTQQIGEGWDAVVFRVDQGDIIKLAKREDVGPLLTTEALVLDLIHSKLPVRIPRLIASNDSSNAWPSGYLIQSYISGKPLSEVDTKVGSNVATQLGTALRELHDIPVDKAMQTDLPLQDRREWASEFGASALRKIADRRGATIATQITFEATRILGTSDYYDVEPTLIHNDLHSGHLLLEPGEPLGIIDWGDAGLGDPDIDFLFLYWAMGWEFIEASLKAYGHKDPTALHKKLDDLLLLYSMFLIFLAAEYGSAEEETMGWELLDDWTERRL